MQELKILKQLTDTLQEEWGSQSPSEQSETISTLWEVQGTIQKMLEGYKEQLRASEQSKVVLDETTAVYVGKPSTYWTLKEDADLLGLQKSLGSMFNALFYAKLKTTPKFEEMISGLPDKQKQMLFDNVEQRHTKASVRFVKRKV